MPYLAPDPVSSDPAGPTQRLITESSPGDNAPPLSISEIAQALKRHIESGFSHIRLRGEISGWKRAASGHAYFTLKDSDAAIDAVLWKGTSGRLTFHPEDGLDVIATGKITTYPGRSKYQIVVESLELAGEGALLALLEKTKARLAAEGLFAPAHKRSLPALPHRIGIVTSPTGAVIHDIIHRLEARFPVEVIVWPVLVQGNGSAQQVVAAVEGFSALPPSARPDLVIIARGGGSIEDLWTFNEEIVVRAIAASLIPTISAVGHETDTTLADYAADLRAPTPTAAAELAVPVRAQLAAAIESLHLRSLKAISNKAERARERFEAQARRLPSGDTLLGQVRQRFDDRSAALVRGLADRIALSRLMLSGVSAALRPVVLTNRLTLKQERFYQLNQHIKPDILQTRLSDARTRLEQTWRLAQSFHPDRPLALGYARIETHRGDTVTTARAAQAARHLRLRFRDGAVDTIVDSKDVSPPLEPKRPRPYKDKSVQPKLL